MLFQQITLLDIVLVDKLTPFNSMKITYHSFQLCYRAKQRLVFTIQIVSSEMRVSKAQTRSSAGNTKFKFVFSSEAEPLNAFSLVNYQLWINHSLPIISFNKDLRAVCITIGPYNEGANHLWNCVIWLKRNYIQFVHLSRSLFLYLYFNLETFSLCICICIIFIV